MQEMIFWHWWILAGVLLVIELLSMTVYLLWIAIAAALIGVIAYLMPSLHQEGQLLIFAILSLISVYACYRYLHRQPLTQEQSSLNNRAEQLVGKLADLETPLLNGSGKIKLGDTLWLVEGNIDLPAGAKVRVVGVDGTKLRVVEAS